MDKRPANSALLRIFRLLAILQLANLLVLIPLYGVYVDLHHGGATELETAGHRIDFLVHMSAIIILLILSVCAYVGLLRCRHWARLLLPVIAVLSLLEPTVFGHAYGADNIESVLSDISQYVDGALIALAWWSELRFAFVRIATVRTGAAAAG